MYLHDILDDVLLPGIVRIIQDFVFVFKKEIHTWKYLAQTGNIDGLRYLYENKIEDETKSLAYVAAAHVGNFKVVSFLYDIGIECSASHIAVEIRKGSFNVLKFLGTLEIKCLVKIADTQKTIYICHDNQYTVFLTGHKFNAKLFLDLIGIKYLD